MEKEIMLGNIEGSSERGRSNMRCIDFLKEAIGVSLQKLSRAIVDVTPS